VPQDQRFILSAVAAPSLAALRHDEEQGPVTLHLVHVLPSFEPGGAQLRVGNIINHLGARATHTILALDGNFAAAYRISSACRVRYEPLPPGRGWSHLVGLRRMIAGLRPDLLLTYNWGAIDALLAARVPPLCPIIQNECGLTDEADGLKWRRVWLRRLVLNRIYATVVTSSSMYRIAATRFRVRPSKLRFIRTGVDTERFRPGRAPELRRQMGIEEQALLYGYVGGLRPEKNVAMLLRAFAAGAPRTARLALFGDGAQRAALETLAGELGVRDRVRFAGHRQDSTECFAVLDVFLMSSRTEQTPNALLEAMASGAPAICTDVGDTAELLGAHQRPYVVDRGDEAAYGACVGALGQDAELRQRLGAENRRRCLELYSIREMLVRYAALYEEAVRSWGRGERCMS
jgi:glycosyltransferase involved in cell wall biosynthesis